MSSSDPEHALNDMTMRVLDPVLTITASPNIARMILIHVINDIEWVKGDRTLLWCAGAS
jgi:hypothetical protein